MKDDRAPSQVRFGPFQLDLQGSRLLRSGIEVRLQSQPLRLLTLLVRHHGRTISRDEIRRAVWEPGTHVDFDQGINACVRQVRAALGDSADRPRYVETVPKRGYRFVAATETSPSEPAARARHGWSGIVGALALLGVSAAVLALAWGPTPVRPAQRPMLVILPFEDLSSEPTRTAGLEDALTEELIAEVGRRYARQLGVIARTSAMKYKGTDKGIDEIAAELGADYLLEGSVRREADRVRITAQLIRADDQSHLWTNSYERELGGLLDLQIELGEVIARALALQLLPGEGGDGPRPATDPRAYRAYLRGSQLLSRGMTVESVVEAQRVLRQATAIEPGFAAAWLRLSEAYTAAELRGLAPPSAADRQRSHEALARALALDDSLAAAHLRLAMVRFYREFDLEGARREFERAIEIHPGYAEAYHRFAAYLSVTGRHDEAIAMVRRARRLDPLASMVNSDIGWYYYFARRYDEAIEHSQRTLELDPGFYWAELCIQLALMQQGRFDAFVEQTREFLLARGAPAEALAALDRSDPAAGARGFWRWRLGRLDRLGRQRVVPPSSYVYAHMALGQYDQALERLERAFEMRTGWLLPFLVVDPVFDPLRSDRRFRDLLQRVADPEPSAGVTRGGA